jgi:hypothetical protein
MELDFAFLADAATVDASGKLSVLGVFDRIRAREFPARHGRIVLVMRLAAGPEDVGEHEVAIRLRSPERQEVLRVDGQVRVGVPPPSDDRIRISQVLNLDGIVFPRPGRFHFEIRLDGDEVARLPLVLEGAGGPPEGQDPATSGPGTVPIVFAPGGPAEA